MEPSSDGLLPAIGLPTSSSRTHWIQHTFCALRLFQPNPKLRLQTSSDWVGDLKAQRMSLADLSTLKMELLQWFLAWHRLRESCKCCRTHGRTLQNVGSCQSFSLLSCCDLPQLQLSGRFSKGIQDLWVAMQTAKGEKPCPHHLAWLCWNQLSTLTVNLSTEKYKPS